MIFLTKVFILSAKPDVIYARNIRLSGLADVHQPYCQWTGNSKQYLSLAAFSLRFSHCFLRMNKNLARAACTGDSDVIH